MNISFNSKAICSDGPCGNLNHIILKSVSGKITHLVIHVPSSGKEYLIPIDMVSEFAHDQIQIQCTRDELRSMPEFKMQEYVPRSIFRFQIKPYLITPHAVLPDRFVPVNVDHIPAGELAVKKGAKVEATDGEVGFVDEILMDTSDNSLSHFILRQGHLWGQKEVTISVDKVDRIEEDIIHLKISKSEVESLPSIPIHRFWIKKD